MSRHVPTHFDSFGQSAQHHIDWRAPAATAAAKPPCRAYATNWRVLSSNSVPSQHSTTPAPCSPVVAPLTPPPSPPPRLVSCSPPPRARLRVGDIAYLTARPAEFAANFPDSPIFRYSHFTDAYGNLKASAFGHPVLVISTSNASGHLLFFPITGFSSYGGDIMAKYRSDGRPNDGLAKHRIAYLEIEQQGGTDKSHGHDGTPILRLANTRYGMPKQSYLNTQSAFCIEDAALAPARGVKLTSGAVIAAISQHNRHSPQHIDGVGDWTGCDVQAPAQIPLVRQSGFVREQTPSPSSSPSSSRASPFASDPWRSQQTHFQAPSRETTPSPPPSPTRSRSDAIRSQSSWRK